MEATTDNCRKPDICWFIFKLFWICRQPDARLRLLRVNGSWNIYFNISLFKNTWKLNNPTGRKRFLVFLKIYGRDRIWSETQKTKSKQTNKQKLSGVVLMNPEYYWILNCPESLMTHLSWQRWKYKIMNTKSDNITPDEARKGLHSAGQSFAHGACLINTHPEWVQAH